MCKLLERHRQAEYHPAPPPNQQLSGRFGNGTKNNSKQKTSFQTKISFEQH